MAPSATALRHTRLTNVLVLLLLAAVLAVPRPAGADPGEGRWRIKGASTNGGVNGCLFRTQDWYVRLKPVGWQAGDPAWRYVYRGPGVVYFTFQGREGFEVPKPLPRADDGSVVLTKKAYGDEGSVAIAASVGQAPGLLELYVGGVKQDEQILDNDNDQDEDKPLCLVVTGKRIKIDKVARTDRPGRASIRLRSDTGASLKGVSVDVRIERDGKRPAVVRTMSVRVTGTATRVRIPRLPKGRYRIQGWIETKYRGKNSRVEPAYIPSTRFRVKR